VFMWLAMFRVSRSLGASFISFVCCLRVLGVERSFSSMVL